MPIPPSSVREGKLTNAESLSIARVGQAQKYDRWRMGWDGRMGLISA
jgi:hypothetical protein